MLIHIYLEPNYYIFAKDNSLHSGFCYTFGVMSHISKYDPKFRQIIEKGIDSSLIVNNDIEEVRMICAQFGSDEDRELLIGDTWRVQEQIAIHGSTSHKWKLINHEHYRVRLAIAEYGDNDMRLRLLSDKNKHVRICAEAFVTK